MMIYHPSNPSLFSVSTDLDACLIRAKFTKLWDQDTFELYKEAMIGEMGKFHKAKRAFDTITDSTEFPPQPQFLNDPRQELISIARKMGLRKSAVIVTNAIMKLQLIRLSSDVHRYFTNEREALTWLRA